MADPLALIREADTEAEALRLALEQIKDYCLRAEGDARSGPRCGKRLHREGFRPMLMGPPEGCRGLARLVCAVLFCLALSVVSSAEEPKRVLLLNSYGSDFEPFRFFVARFSRL